jgi:hypothetical protein
VPRRVRMPAADELFRTTAGNGTLLQGTRGEDDGSGGSRQGEARSSDRAGERNGAGERGSPAGRLRTAASQIPPAGSGTSTASRGTAAPEGGVRTSSGLAGGANGAAGSRGVPGHDGGHGGRSSAAGSADGSAHGSADPARDAAVPMPGTGASGRVADSERRRGIHVGDADDETDHGARTAGAPVPPQAASAAASGRKVSAPRRPSGRERHDEKITVYVSPDELLGLEHARITLRGEYGVAVDRGRIVREAVAALLADLDARGSDSILVKRLSAGG